MVLQLAAVCRDRGASMKLSLQYSRCPSPLPALHMFLLKDLVILEPNSSKFQLSYVCTITQKYVALYGKEHQTQSLLVCHGILCLPKQDEFHPVL